MSTRIGRLFAGVWRRHPVTVRKASLMARPMRRVWAEAQYSVVEWSRAKVAVATLLLQHPWQSQQATSSVRRAMSTFCDVTWLKVSEICERPAQRYSAIFGLKAKGQGFVVVVDFWLTFSFLVVEVEGCQHLFLVMSFSFHFWRILHIVTMSLRSTPCTVCSLYQHTWLLGLQRMHAFWRRWLAGQGCRCWREGMPRRITVWRHSRPSYPLRLCWPVVRVKLRLPIISMIMWTACLSGSNCSRLQVRPWCHVIPYSVVGCCDIEKHISGHLRWRKALLNILGQSGDLIDGRTPVSKTHLVYWLQLSENLSPT